MRLILAIILLLGASGVALAQFAPWQPMLWKPTTATPPPPVTSPADLELTIMNNQLTILN